MCLKELQAEVRKRQAAVLRPAPGSAEEGMNAFQRQKRLRYSPHLCTSVSVRNLYGQGKHHVTNSMHHISVVHGFGSLVVILAGPMLCDFWRSTAIVQSAVQDCTDCAGGEDA